jgi:hypothetical protein
MKISPEENAKNWQIQTLTDALAELKQSNDRYSVEIKGMLQTNNQKIDDLPKYYVTQQQLGDAIKLIHAEYRPMKDTIKKIGIAVGSFLAIAVVQLFLNYKSG